MLKRHNDSLATEHPGLQSRKYARGEVEHVPRHETERDAHRESEPVPRKETERDAYSESEHAKQHEELERDGHDERDGQ